MDFEILTSTPLRQVPDDYAPEGSARWFTLAEGPDTGRTIFYVDHRIGPGPPEQTVVLVHGNPECSYTFRHVIRALMDTGRSVRIVAMDHVGFGLSDQAGFEMVDMHHAANLNQLIRALDLREITLVVHDWGGPIGIGAVIDEPERVAALVVLNSTVFPMPPTGATYRNFPYPWLAWCWTPFLISWRLWGGLAAHVVLRAEPQRTVPFLARLGRSLYRHARDRFVPDSPEAVFAGQFTTRSNAIASKRHVRQTPVWGHGYTYRDRVHGLQDNHEFYARIQRSVPVVRGARGRPIPALGFFGSWDAAGKPEVVAQWQEALPQMAASTRIFPENGHFIEEHRGPEIAAGILGLTG